MLQCARKALVVLSLLPHADRFEARSRARSGAPATVFAASARGPRSPRGRFARRRFHRLAAVSGIEVEVCVDGIDGVIAAKAAGAQRVELCADLALGGTTPSAGLVRAALEVGIEIVVLVRPRAGDFLYTSSEFDVMLRDVEFARSSGAGGVAIGVLTGAGGIDRERCAHLVDAAGTLDVCFHRAFDGTSDAFAALEALIELGFARVLSSGQAQTVSAGAARLRGLVEVAAGRIQIMPGGGVRQENIRSIVAATGASAIHFSAAGLEPSAMQFRNSGCSLTSRELPGDFELQRTSADRIRAFISALYGDA